MPLAWIYPLTLILLFGCAEERAGSDALPMDGFGGGGTSTSAAPEVAEDAPLVVFLGDSLAAGLHLPAEQAFPAAAQRLLVDREQPFRLVNAGVSGDTTAGGLARLDWLLRQSPDILVVELGGNDGLRGLPVEQVESNLRAILERTLDAGVRPLLLGMDAPPSLGPGYPRAFREVYHRLGEELEVPVVRGFLEGVGGIRSMNLPDGIHPTPEGHERLAENLAGALEELLDELRP